MAFGVFTFLPEMGGRLCGGFYGYVCTTYLAPFTLWMNGRLKGIDACFD